MEGNSLLRNILASCFSMFQDVENIPNFWLLFKPYFQNMGEEYPCLVWKYIENESAKKENKIEVYMHSPPHQLLICEKARNPEKLKTASELLDAMLWLQQKMDTAQIFTYIWG